MTIPANPMGFESTGYYNTGTFGSPTWVAIAILRDVTLKYERATHDISTRGDGGNKAQRGGLTEWGADFEVAYQPAATSYAALLSAFNNRTGTEFLFLDGTTAGGSGAQGPRVFCEVTKFARKEPLDGPDAVDVSITRTYSSSFTSSWYTQS